MRFFPYFFVVYFTCGVLYNMRILPKNGIPKFKRLPGSKKYIYVHSMGNSYGNLPCLEQRLFLFRAGFQSLLLVLPLE